MTKPIPWWHLFARPGFVTVIHLIMMSLNLTTAVICFRRGEWASVAFNSLVVVVSSSTMPLLLHKVAVLAEEMGKLRAERLIAEEMLSKIQGAAVADIETDIGITGELRHSARKH